MAQPIWIQRAAMLVVAAALAAGCGSDGDDAGTTTTTVGTTTTAGDTTTTAGGSTTSTTAADLPDEPPLLDDAVSGSGCTPGADELPDGWWYGTIETSSGALEFDLACYYIGAAAEAEAASRGDEVNNDYYVVNDNPQTRTVTLAADATAECVELGAGVVMADCDPADVDGEWAVWLRVQGGTVDRIVEQYAP